jgi:hypothetical protein
MTKEQKEEKLEQQLQDLRNKMQLQDLRNKIQLQDLRNEILDRFAALEALQTEINPLQYVVYKGKLGAVQFNYLPACYQCKTCREKNPKSWLHIKNKNCTERMEMKSGAILIEITNGAGNNVYEWQNKISFALDANDLSAIINTFARGDKLRLLHDPNIKSQRQGQLIKILEFDVGKDGGYLLKVSQSSRGEGDDKSLRHMVPLSGDEVRILRILFGAVIPKLLAWV